MSRLEWTGAWRVFDKCVIKLSRLKTEGPRLSKADLRSSVDMSWYGSSKKEGRWRRGRKTRETLGKFQRCLSR